MFFIKFSPLISICIVHFLQFALYLSNMQIEQVPKWKKFVLNPSNSMGFQSSSILGQLPSPLSPLTAHLSPLLEHPRAYYNKKDAAPSRVTSYSTAISSIAVAIVNTHTLYIRSPRIQRTLHILQRQQLRLHLILMQLRLPQILHLQHK